MNETVAEFDESNSIEASVESPTLPIEDSVEPKDDDCIVSSDADVTPLNDDLNTTDMMIMVIFFFCILFILLGIQGFHT